MKYLQTFLILCALLLGVVMMGCEVQTDEPQFKKDASKGNDLVINEIFAISPDKYYAYSWIELFNPSKFKIRWFEENYPVTG